MSPPAHTVETVEQVFDFLNDRVKEYLQSATFKYLKLSSLEGVASPRILIDKSTVRDDFPNGAPVSENSIKALLAIRIILPDRVEKTEQELRDDFMKAHNKAMDDSGLGHDWITYYDDDEWFQDPEDPEKLKKLLWYTGKGLHGKEVYGGQDEDEKNRWPGMGDGLDPDKHIAVHVVDFGEPLPCLP